MQILLIQGRRHMSAVTLYQGCSYEVLRDLIAHGMRVHAVICDPPYFLESIARRFGSASAAPAKFGNDGAFTRAGQKFTGKTWDTADEQGRRISFDPDFWKLVFDLLLPGGHVIAFGSPRTGHWQAVAIETAGFTMHPFDGWAYDSGLPKPHPAAKAFKRLGGTPEEIEQWSGWAYGAQAKKPALEPIYVAQRPFDRRNGVENLRAHGVGAINIEACRVPAEDGKSYHPANLVHDGSEAVLTELGESARFFYGFQTDTFSGSPRFNPKAGKADKAGSQHPSVKPVDLLRYYARLYTPPGGTILDPFAGSGTTGEAALKEGFDCILVERDPDYVNDIARRFGVVPVGGAPVATIDDLL